MWSINLPISTKRTIISHFKSLNIKTVTTYDIGNPGPVLGPLLIMGSSTAIQI